MKTASNGRQPPMEDDLKLFKVEYLSNRLMDHAQILNLSLHDHTKLNEDDLKWKMTSKY